ncbi:hypothetical protein AB433_07795 [Croceicoccus naphthovorans]|uniref:Acyl-CoA thioesterase n=1 Tax=Croceicoccus naphthovorans TaxID=1348774 RepID=A0A0G3XLZ2_9SPHN|nr:hypothetical protein AB433_07795 [Croceicoccus naphthovorans]
MVDLLDVAPVSQGLFRGRRKIGGTGRIYGGQVVAQALAAASKTVPGDRSVHSLHAYFLRGGIEDYEIDYSVESDFDGGNFANRRVIATQQGQVLLNLVASFSRLSRGHHHQLAMAAVPQPEELDPVHVAVSRHPDAGQKDRWYFYMRNSPIELRPVGALPYMPDDDRSARIRFWFRAANDVEAPQWMHRAIVAYASDLAMIATAAKPHIPFDIQVASLDHSLWFHRDVRADEWLLTVIDSPWAGEGRGLARASIFVSDGHLVASAAQECLMRDRAMR